MRRCAAMTLPYALLVLVMVAVVFGVGALATGRAAGLQPTESGRPPMGLPEGGALVPEDLHRLRLGVGVRGYRMDDVDTVLDRVAAELAARDARIRQLEAELSHPGAEHPRTPGDGNGAGD